MANKRSFKKVGANILQSSGPKSITEFLKGGAQAQESSKSGEPESHEPMHSCADVQTYKSSLREERLHVFIEGRIADKLMDEVYKRKKDPDFANRKASKRGVVEDALNNYLG